MLQHMLEKIGQLIVLVLICSVTAFITFIATSEYVVQEYSGQEFAVNYRHEQMMLKHWKYCPYCGEVLEEE